jgi:hypothetical protein
MSDCYPGEIRIGGKVSAALVEEFSKQVAANKASVGGYDGSPFDPKRNRLAEVLDENGYLYLADSEARFGMFEELEAFCVEHGISFDRHSDAFAQYDAENVSFRPGMKEPKVFAATQSGDTLLRAEEVQKVLDLLKPCMTGNESKARLEEGIGQAVAGLTALLPSEETLPRLEIVEG